MEVSIAGGLTASTTYPAHVHKQTCSDGEGGGHYKIDDAITDGTKTPHLYMTTSSDSGKTWSDPRPIPGARSVCPRLLLLDNGVLALSFGRLYRPKQGNALMFSADGGRNLEQADRGLPWPFQRLHGHGGNWARPSPITCSTR